MLNNSNGVIIRTPARLHFTLIDLNGELGRIDGGIGVAIDKPNWLIKISESPEWYSPLVIKDILRILKENLHITRKYKIEFKSELPIHVGLGSQTQLSLAIAHGLSIIEGKKYSINKLASLVGRGGTSGIGVAAYSYGGLILDGGHTKTEKPEFLPSHFSSAKPAVLVHRLKVPDDWYFVITIPAIGKGKYGAEEKKIFNKYCPIPTQDVEKLSRIILMQLLPAIVENDIINFGDGLNKIQAIGFKHIENRLQHKFVKDLQDFYLNNGASGTGLSSFGPATFCVIRKESAALNLVTKTKKFLNSNSQKGTVFYTQANNTGADIKKF